MRSKKIIVTGGAGFIGSHIVDAYLSLGHQVVVVDNLSIGKKRNINPKANFYNCDITDYKNLKKIILSENPQVISHHAAQTKVIKSINDPLFNITNNVIGTINILEVIKELTNFEQIIFASSGGAIYSELSPIPTKENAPIEPLSPYGISKRSCELYIQSYYNNFGINYTIFRYANVYGPRQLANGEGGVIAIFCKSLINGENVKIYGDGEQTRDYIYVKDIVAANVEALKSAKQRIYNIGTQEEVSVNQLHKIISEKINISNKPKYLPARPGEMQKSCLNSNLANRKLNWSNKTNIENGLKETLNWFKSQLNKNES